MKKIICDTGIISRYIARDMGVRDKQIEKIVATIENIGLTNIVITIVNKIELLNWISSNPHFTKTERPIVVKFIKDLTVIHINEPISKLTEVLSIKNINSKPADTFISAIAKYHKIPIYTLNTKDFEILKAPLF